jgi:hypothetical protein
MHAPVGAHGDRLVEDLLGRRRPHGDGRDVGAVGVPELKGGFEGMLAGRIHHAFGQLAFQGSGLGIPRQLGYHGNLLDANYYSLFHMT